MLQFVDPLAGLVQAHFLDDHRLHQGIGRVRLPAQAVLDQRLGVGVFGPRAGPRQTIKNALDKIFFLGSHRHFLLVVRCLWKLPKRKPRKT